MKNEFIDTLLTRRSCRSYTDQMPTEEQLQTIVNAGLYAPSAMNKQSAIMICITNKEVISLLSKLNAQVMGKDIDPFYGAPAVIAVLADSSSAMFVQDGSLEMQNMMLAAHGLGLGSCWINRAYEVFHMLEGKKLKEEWNIPDSYEGVAFCIVGYPATPAAEPSARRNNRIITIK